MAKMPLNFEAREDWNYSFSHDVLAAVIEIVSDKKHRDYVKENIFEPLDMEQDVIVYTDCIKQVLKPGELIEIQPGDSITLEPYVYHRFYAKKGHGILIAGEVSKVNDDNTDNVFYQPSERFSNVEEDEEVTYLLVNEYNF